MKCAYHPSYQVALPPGHPFPMSKYSRLLDLLLAEGILAAADVLLPEPLDAPTLELVHTPEYLAKLASSGLSAAEQRRLGLPWSEALWERARLAAGGGAVIDLDVHQGNGTAAIFEAENEVFTFSMHGERNYPLAKMRSNVDVPLRDGVGDGEYLDVLQRNLPVVLDGAKPDIAFYLAGVDVAAGDRYGKLALTEDGIRRRDRCVIESVRGRAVPLTIVLAGGYAPSRARTADLHAHVFREAAEYERACVSRAL